MSYLWMLLSSELVRKATLSKCSGCSTKDLPRHLIDLHWTGVCGRWAITMPNLSIDQLTQLQTASIFSQGDSLRFLSQYDVATDLPCGSEMVRTLFFRTSQSISESLTNIRGFCMPFISTGVWTPAKNPAWVSADAFAKN